MKLLLDTHIWIWALLDPVRLNRGLATLLEEPDHELWLSPISIWETQILIRRKRIAVELEADEWIRLALQTVPMREAPLTHQVALEMTNVHLTHRDPADRFLAATARYYELALVTADDRLLRGEGFATVPNA